jgi:hypothetical protein
LRDRHIGGYRVVHAGSKNGAKLWKLIGQEVSAEVVKEHHGHRGDVQSHVHSSNLLEGHHIININGHPDVQICSVDVHCESITHPNEISSNSSSITKAMDLLLTDPFFQPKKSVHKSNLTPFICREGCKHYDGVKDASDGIFKEFCCYGRSCKIKESSSCDHFEDKNPVWDEEDGILRL